MGDRLRIGLDYRPALLTRSGIGRVARELARALASERGIELRLFGHSLARCRVPATVGDALARWPIPGRTLPLLRRIGLGADRLCGGAAVFHWTDYVYPPLSRARAVVTVHDTSFATDEAFHGAAQSRVLHARCASALAAAQRVIVPTRATAADVERVFALPRASIEVVPFGADHVLRDAPRAAHPRAGQPFVLALGTIEPRKNHERLLAAWRTLDAPRPDLVVIGRAGWECDTTLRALDEAVRDGGVTWLADADDATVRAHLAHAAVLAYPSRLEGFGFPPLEAAALGTPVVAGDTPALREVLGDGAELCEPESIDAIRAALVRVLTDEGHREALRGRGRARAARFTWSRCAHEHARIYAEVAAA